MGEPPAKLAKLSDPIWLNNLDELVLSKIFKYVGKAYHPMLRSVCRSWKKVADDLYKKKSGRLPVIDIYQLSKNGCTLDFMYNLLDYFPVNFRSPPLIGVVELQYTRYSVHYVHYFNQIILRFLQGAVESNTPSYIIQFYTGVIMKKQYTDFSNFFSPAQISNLGVTLSCAAVRANNFVLLQWVERMFRIYIENQVSVTRNFTVFTEALRAGNLDIIKWLCFPCGEDITYYVKDISFSEQACAIATCYGKFDVFLWLVGRNRDGSVDPSRKHLCHWDNRVIEGFARFGNKDMVRWVIEHEFVDLDDGEYIDAVWCALNVEKIDMAEWLVSPVDDDGTDKITFPIPDIDRAYTLVAQNNSPIVADWLHRHGLEMNEMTDRDLSYFYNDILINGSVDALKWALSSTLLDGVTEKSVVKCPDIYQYLQQANTLLDKYVDNVIYTEKINQIIDIVKSTI